MPVFPARVIGHGPDRLIIVHGWLGDHRLFEPFFDCLDAARFTCAYLDCRGYGERRSEPGPYSIAAIAADILALAESLGWETFHVVGHSMAGMAAQRLMADAPRRLASAILIAPVPASGARIDKARRELLRRAIVDAAARRELIDRNTGQARDRGWVDELLELSLAATARAPLEEYMAAWIETDFAVEVKGAALPALVICGALDPGCSAARMRETILAWCPNSSLALLDGAGHYPMRESPAALAELISTFLSPSGKCSRIKESINMSGRSAAW